MNTEPLAPGYVSRLFSYFLSRFWLVAGISGHSLLGTSLEDMGICRFFWGRP